MCPRCLWVSTGRFSLSRLQGRRAPEVGAAACWSTSRRVSRPNPAQRGEKTLNSVFNEAMGNK